MCISCTPFGIFYMAVQKSHRSKSKVTVRNNFKKIKLNLTKVLAKGLTKGLIKFI
jgi:hypothetical protein